MGVAVGIASESVGLCRCHHRLAPFRDPAVNRMFPNLHERSRSLPGFLVAILE